MRSTAEDIDDSSVAPVRARDVTRFYVNGEADRFAAVDGVSLEVGAGEIVALTGPSGCGKSTLLNLIGCVDLPSSGVVLIEGRETTQLDDNALTTLRCMRIGTVFQFFNLLPTLNVTENVAVPLVLQKRGRTEIAARVGEALDAVSMRHKARSFPEELSGGEAQRVAVARAIVHRPAVMLADEPTGNLDAKNAAQVMQLFRDLASGGQAILLATHSPDAAALCDRVIRMEQGRIVG